jgi:hypothetical protein
MTYLKTVEASAAQDAVPSILIQQAHLVVQIAAVEDCLAGLMKK